MAIKARSRTPNPAALPWQRARKIVQISTLTIFFTLLLATRGGEFPDIPPSLFFRFDPLSMITSIIARREWLPGLTLALITIGLTIIAGRVWCGWLCPLGTTLDIFHPRRRLHTRNSQSSRWRTLKYIVLIVIVGAALTGNLTLLVFDPISLITRGLTSFALPGVNQLALASERVLYNIPALQGGLDWFEASVRTPLFPADVWRWWNILPGLLLIGVIALNWAADRFWCRYLCPLGGLLGLVSRFAIIRRVVGDDACRNCVRCARTCPTGTIDPQKHFASDPAECTVCLDCLPECPTPKGQTFKPIWKTAPAQHYDPNRRQALLTIGAGITAAALYPLVPIGLRRDPKLIRPPGAQNENFLSACLRCSECMKVCPTSGLQPAAWESGFDGWWTPTLVPRLGYCDYACNACGQVCPTNAIPNLPLEVKRIQVIGRAAINKDRCLPWSQNIPCIVCEEMCPLAPKAVELETIDVVDNTGQSITLQRPTVLTDRCIGCGICEYKCPVSDAAAIQISGLLHG